MKFVLFNKGIILFIINYIGDCLYFGFVVEWVRVFGLGKNVCVFVVIDDVLIGWSKCLRVGCRGLLGYIVSKWLVLL